MTRLILDPPSGEPTGSTAMIDAEIAPDAATLARLDAIAREVAGSYLGFAPLDAGFDAKVDQLAHIGRREVDALAEQARRSLARSSASDGTTAVVNDQLTQLRRIVERLDPGADDTLLKPRKLFGLFDMGEQLTSYFDRYRSAEDAIDRALAALVDGRDRLLLDNVAIDADRRASRAALARLAEALYLCAALDKRFEKLAGQLEASDAAKAKRLREVAQFQVRQRHSDLLTQMAVSLQGYQVLGIVRANNIELAKGIDRTMTTTITALRTAIVSAQALADQQLLLDKIAGVTSAATASIDAAAKPIDAGNRQLARDSDAAIAQLAALRQSFADVYATVDAVGERQRAGMQALSALDTQLALECR